LRNFSAPPTTWRRTERISSCNASCNAGAKSLPRLYTQASRCPVCNKGLPRQPTHARSVHAQYCTTSMCCERLQIFRKVVTTLQPTAAAPKTVCINTPLGIIIRPSA
jgi:hypothetical protein